MLEVTIVFSRDKKMSVFEYVAFDTRGNRRKGFIDAPGIAAARQMLREENVYPVEIKPSLSKKENTLSGIFSIHIWERVSAAEVAVFTRQLSTLLGAGMPLVPSLSILIKQSREGLLKKTIAQIREQVNEGKSLTEAISAFPGIFPPLYLNMVRAGEASGTINLVLERLADFSENQQEMLSKIKSAMYYPFVMLFVGIFVILYFMAFLVPKITSTFEDMHQTLPLVTVILIAVSNFLKKFWWAILLGLTALLMFIRYMKNSTEAGRRFWDGLKIKIPLFGEIHRKIAIARFCRTLATLLQSGVPLLAAMEIVRNIVNNVHIGDAIHQAARDLEEGKGLSGPLTQSGLFPPLVTEMIAVGEQSGTLEKMLNRVANAYETEAQTDVTKMTSLLGPLMVIFMGMIVLFIVVSILLPIFEMNQLVR